MKTIVAYLFGLIGFLLQGSAVVGLPTYVLFFGGSAWWMLAFFPLGFVGIPLSIMKSMLDSNKKG
jgi:TRAP-type C4-dicarboxylate transport system permease small subunit